MQNTNNKNNVVNHKEMLLQQFIFCDHTRIENNGIMAEEKIESEFADIICKPAHQSTVNPFNKI